MPWSVIRLPNRVRISSIRFLENDGIDADLTLQYIDFHLNNDVCLTYNIFVAGADLRANTIASRKGELAFN